MSAKLEQKLSSDDITALTLSGLFNAEHYLHNNPDVQAAGLDPLVHFCRYGWREGRAPNPYFDVGFYLKQATEAAAAGLNPLLHYLRVGEAAGLAPGPLFDPLWYGAAYGLSAGVSRLAHFLRNRISGEVAPSAAAFAVPALRAYRDERSLREDPFVAYARDHDGVIAPERADVMLIGESGLLDGNFYLINAPDVMEAEQDPVVHFCRYGWREGRDPSLYVDVAWYLRTNARVAAMGINPLVHYIVAGERAGRRPCVYFDPVWYRRRYGPFEGTALGHFMAHRRGQTVSPNALFDVGWYLAEHARGVGPNRDPFAHYLFAARVEDIDPSPEFSASAYRRKHLGRRSRHFAQIVDERRDMPLLHALMRGYQ